MTLFSNSNLIGAVSGLALTLTLATSLYSCKTTGNSNDAELMSKKPNGTTNKIWCGNKRAFLTVELPQDTSKLTDLDFISLGNMDDAVGVRHNVAGKVTSDPARLPTSSAWKDSLVFALPDKKYVTGTIITSTIMIQPEVFKGQFAAKTNMDARYVTKNGNDPEMTVSMTCKMDP